MTSAAYELAALFLVAGAAGGWYANRAYAARTGRPASRSPRQRGWRRSGFTAFLVAGGIVFAVVRLAHHFHHPL